MTEKDPKDKNEDKNKKKNSRSGQPSGQAPILVPAAFAVDGVSVPDCSTDMAAALGPVPVPGQVAATAATPGFASVPSGTQGVSDATPGVASTPSGTRGVSDAFNSTGSDAGENGKYSEVCRYHKCQKCMRRAECKYRHPNVCQNIEEFGLCKGKCDLIHQLVCKSFWFKGFCTRQICGFIHPTKIDQRAHIGNGYGNAENRGHNRNRNRNRNDYQQHQGHTSFGNRHNRNNRRDYQQDQGHTSYGNRNYRNNGYNNQGYQDNLSWDTHNTNTNFLSQQIEELMWRMKRLEGEKQIRWSRRQ